MKQAPQGKVEQVSAKLWWDEYIQDSASYYIYQPEVRNTTVSLPPVPFTQGKVVNNVWKY